LPEIKLQDVAASIFGYLWIGLVLAACRIGSHRLFNEEFIEFLAYIDILGGLQILCFPSSVLA
jgi:hypothetical protein